MSRFILFAETVLGVFFLAAQLSAAEPQFRDVELKTRLTVGYAVRLIDMNHDQRLDIAIVDSDRIIWLENPNWEEHTLIKDQTKKDNVCFAPYDIDGDGNIDFAVGADWKPFNTETGGTIQWIRKNQKPDALWQLHDIGEEPTIHRMAFADLDGDGRAELIAAPLMGRKTTKPSFSEHPVRLLLYKIPKDPVAGPWIPEVLSEEVHVSHNLFPTDFNGDGKLDILLVSFEGISVLERQADGKWKRTRVGAGNQATSPNKGASEIKYGKLGGGGNYIATIEPWHGNQVVVYTKPDQPRPTSGEWLWNRIVLDEQLKWGHAVWCANIDDDEDEELIIGVRDDLNSEFRCGVRIYDPQDKSGKTWKRTIIDPGSVAIEDLAAADLNGDGRTDIVAVGRATHNVKIYWNETKK